MNTTGFTVFGFLCKYEKARSLRKGEWITVTARIEWEHANVYGACRGCSG